MAIKKAAPMTAIKRALDDVRPQLQLDGGDVEFGSFDSKTGVLKVKFKGHCAHCPMSMITLQSGIGAYVMEKVKEVKQVISE